MDNAKDAIISILINKGYELVNRPFQKIAFSGIPQADDLLNNINEFPHVFVLGCVMDTQIAAEKAWKIPYEIAMNSNNFNFSSYLNLNLNQINEIFKIRKLHRFHNKMALNFYLAIQKIHDEYNDDASIIWQESPKSSTIVNRFREFRGVGPKVSTMAVNILARDFKILMADYNGIDISPDIQVMKVFKRLGFIPNSASIYHLINCARKIHPEYPGVYDSICWEIGRDWCKPTNPLCEKCFLEPHCPKII